MLVPARLGLHEYLRAMVTLIRFWFGGAMLASMRERKLVDIFICLRAEPANPRSIGCDILLAMVARHPNGAFVEDVKEEKVEKRNQHKVNNDCPWETVSSDGGPPDFDTLCKSLYLNHLRDKLRIERKACISRVGFTSQISVGWCWRRFLFEVKKGTLRVKK